MTRSILRPQAEADLVERTRYYRAEGGRDLGTRFFDSAVGALDAIGRMPGAASARVGEVCGIDGLRVRRAPDFPCGWFYSVNGDRVDVVRLLTDAQDIAAVLAEIEQPERSEVPISRGLRLLGVALMWSVRQ